MLAEHLKKPKQSTCEGCPTCLVIDERLRIWGHRRLTCGIGVKATIASHAESGYIREEESSASVVNLKVD